MAGAHSRSAAPGIRTLYTSGKSRVLYRTRMRGIGWLVIHLAPKVCRISLHYQPPSASSRARTYSARGKSPVPVQSGARSKLRVPPVDQSVTHNRPCSPRESNPHASLHLGLSQAWLPLHQRSKMPFSVMLRTVSSRWPHENQRRGESGIRTHYGFPFGFSKAEPFARSLSMNGLHHPVMCSVAQVGVEPTHLSVPGFESGASASSAKGPSARSPYPPRVGQWDRATTERRLRESNPHAANDITVFRTDKHAYASLHCYCVPPAGFEPALACLKGRGIGPLPYDDVQCVPLQRLELCAPA